MRPPHYAGENDSHGVAADVVKRASMRPPHYAGENRKADIDTLAVAKLQ